MTFQKSRPADAMHRIMSSFKQFERKLDKLQDDVNYHGQTLNELRVIMNNFSTGTVQNPDACSDPFRRPSIKTTAIQYVVENSDQNSKTKRKSSIRPFVSKNKPKNFPSDQGRLSNDVDLHKSSNSKATMRRGKAEAPRKATSLKTQKTMEKKRAKMTKDIGKV